MQELWDHQKKAITMSKDLLSQGKNYFAFFFEPGLGKSRTLLEVLRSIYTEKKDVIPTYIFCPPVTINNWKNEILKFTKIKTGRIVLLRGSQVERLKLFNESHPQSIFVTNFEALLMKDLFESMYSRARKFTTALVLDEAHKVKSHDSKRTKAAIKLSDVCAYRYLLTGTPILNELWDIWSLYRIMDKGVTFGDSFWAFRARYYQNIMAGRNVDFPKFKAVQGADLVVKEKIQQTSLYAEKSTCLDLPELVRKTVEVELGKDQKRIYDEMKRDMIATIQTQSGDTKVSIAQLAITKALRMLQVLSGHIPVQDDETNEQQIMKIKDNPRKKALEEILEDLAPNHKVIVWAVFRDNYHDIREVCDKLKLKYVELTGETKDKEASMGQFEQDPETRVLIGNPRAGGIGVNLIAASYMIYYSRSYSLEDDVQSEARNYRSGSERHDKITRIDLVAPHTLDQLVLNCLASKQQLSDKVLKENLHDL